MTIMSFGKVPTQVCLLGGLSNFGVDMERMYSTKGMNGRIEVSKMSDQRLGAIAAMYNRTMQKRLSGIPSEIEACTLLQSFRSLSLQFPFRLLVVFRRVNTMLEMLR